MYEQIEGMMGAEEAADSLVSHATKIGDAIKRGDNSLFEIRVAGVNTLLDLLAQYVQQERSKIPASE